MGLFDLFKLHGKEILPTYSFETAINLILDCNYKTAYKIICKYNSELPYPSGIGVDWNKEFVRGLETTQEKIYRDALYKYKNKIMMAGAIHTSMSGKSLRDVFSELTRVYGDSVGTLELLRTYHSIISVEKHFAAYNSANIQEYQFLAALDSKTCPVCGELDGKIFYVKDKKIGINCPPMHDGCRCTTVAVIDEKYLEGSQRIARNAITNRNYYVPRTMYWSEWKNSFK